MSSNLKYTLVVDDPERDERMEIDLHTKECALDAFQSLFYPVPAIRYWENNMRTSNRTQLRHMANRITNTKTGEVLKERMDSWGR
jgi:hypothetical protein